VVCDYRGILSIAVSLYFTEGWSIFEKDLVAYDRAATVIGLCPPNPYFRFSLDRETKTWNLLGYSGSSDINQRTKASRPSILVPNTVSERIHYVSGQTPLRVNS